MCILDAYFSSFFYQREKKINGQFRKETIVGLGSDPDNAAAIYAQGSLLARLFFFFFFFCFACYLFANSRNAGIFNDTS